MLAQLVLVGCGDDARPTEPPARGLKTALVDETAHLLVRRYPSVLEPADKTNLSFEISGRLARNDLEVGQPVAADELLLELDRTALLLAVEEAQAGLRRVQAARVDADRELERQRALYAQDVASESRVQTAQTEAEAARAREDQALKRLETAQENVSKASLRAPFDGVIQSVAVDSFANVAAGETVATIYDPARFEARFAVSYDVVEGLEVGSPVVLRLAHDPGVSLRAEVSEIGAGTEAVSSYPVVVRVIDRIPALRSGMAIEATVEVEGSGGEGFALPHSALLVTREFALDDAAAGAISGEVFVYEPASQQVHRRKVKIVGFRENTLIVSEGISRGDRVAVAGVEFLRDGQRVRLLDDAQRLEEE